MKKIPTLFERKFEGHKVVEVLPNITSDMEWVLNSEGVATVKWDGACCAIINGVFYKRYDAKHGKEIPSGAILCEEKPDSVTGHFPCWVKCDRDNPADKWFWAAYDNLEESKRLEDGTSLSEKLSSCIISRTPFSPQKLIVLASLPKLRLLWLILIGNSANKKVSAHATDICTYYGTQQKVDCRVR